MIEFKLPDIGEGLSEAEIVEWLVRPGDTVKADQPAVIVTTDKATVEIPAPVTGVVRECVGEPGAILPTGSVLMRIEPASVSARAPSRRLVLAAPSTRRLAGRLGVDLAALAGSGPQGRVLADDVRAAAAPAANGAAHAAPPASEEDEIVPLRGLRRRIAHALTESWRTIPHIAEFIEIDATHLVRVQRALRERLEGEGLRLTFLPLFVMAVAVALDRHPNFNASLDLERERIVKHRRRDIGIATATDDGLLVPVLRDAGSYRLRALVRALDGLIERGRARKLSPAESSGASVTITNFGSYGTWLGTPIIRMPESAVVGFGRIRDAVIPVDGAPAVRPVLPIAVAADHRLNDGAHLAGFGATIAALCADPALLLDDGG